MPHLNQQQSTPEQQPITFNAATRQPFSSRNGERPPTKFVVDGLLRQGGLSLLAAKPKQGKSSNSRNIAVCVAQGVPCLGRDTTRGEVVLISLEDQADHVDDCLEALGWNAETDERIYIIEDVPATYAERLAQLDDGLSTHPNIRLVVIDHLTKFLQVGDLNDYSKVQAPIKQLRDLAVRHPHVHVMALAHCKKSQDTGNIFDSLLGSTALRGETDCNIALYQQNGQRCIEAEVRRGRKIDSTILRAEMTVSPMDGAEVVKGFSLDGPFDEWKETLSEKVDRKQKTSCEDSIISILQSTEGQSATRETVIATCGRRKLHAIDAVNRLVQSGVLTMTGKERSPTDPLRVTLNADKIEMHQFIRKGDSQ
jgi:RecA-family ATPase